MTPNQFAAAMRHLHLDIIKNVERAMPIAGEVVAKEARDLLGHDHDFWPPLAESTRAKSVNRKASGPLLETGKHIEETIQMQAHGSQAVIGTNDEVAFIQEHGNEHIPPRPFLTTALRLKADEVTAVIHAAVAKAVAKAMAKA